MANEILRLTSPFEVLEHWPYFLEGMKDLNDPKGGGAKYTNESFFGLLCRTVSMGDKGLVVLVLSKNGKPIAFAVAYETTTYMEERCMFLVEIYSSKHKVENPSESLKKATLDALNYIERYSSVNLGLKSIKTATRRCNGGGLRLFEDKWGFRREYQTFTKEL